MNFIPIQIWNLSNVIHGNASNNITFIFINKYRWMEKYNFEFHSPRGISISTLASWRKVVANTVNNEDDENINNMCRRKKQFNVSRVK